MFSNQLLPGKFLQEKLFPRGWVHGTSLGHSRARGSCPRFPSGTVPGCWARLLSWMLNPMVGMAELKPAGCSLTPAALGWRRAAAMLPVPCQGCAQAGK